MHHMQGVNGKDMQYRARSGAACSVRLVQQHCLSSIHAWLRRGHARAHMLPACCVQGVKVNSKGKEVQHGARLYSIAATRYGDSFDGNTTSLCVRRATYWDSEKGAEDPEKKGLCSNFLCVSQHAAAFLAALLGSCLNTFADVQLAGAHAAPSRAILSAAESLWRNSKDMRSSLQEVEGCICSGTESLAHCTLSSASVALIVSP